VGVVSVLYEHFKSSRSSSLPLPYSQYVCMYVYTAKWLDMGKQTFGWVESLQKSEPIPWPESIIYFRIRSTNPPFSLLDIGNRLLRLESYISRNSYLIKNHILVYYSVWIEPILQRSVRKLIKIGKVCRYNVVHEEIERRLNSGKAFTIQFRILYLLVSYLRA
jgi:hypothetical protein